MDFEKFFVLNETGWRLKTNIHNGEIELQSDEDDSLLIEFEIEKIDDFIEALKSVKDFLNKEV